jgi:hypothetical protein
MNQHYENKIDGLGTASEFEKGMDFYVHMDVVFVESKECSNNKIEQDESELGFGEQQKLIEEHRENIKLLTFFYQEQNRMNQEKWEQQFKKLECNIAAYEQELYEKDTQIVQLQKELETRNKIYTEESLREMYEQ